MNTPSPIVGTARFVYHNPDWSVGWTANAVNGVTYEGANWLLETGFRGNPQPAAIYGMLIASVGFSDNNILDTHASHPGWNEWTGISNLTRPQWVPVPANGGLLGTGTSARFYISTTGHIRGAGLTTISTLGSLAAGVLYNTAITTAAYAVAAGGVLDVAFSARLRG